MEYNYNYGADVPTVAAGGVMAVIFGVFLIWLLFVVAVYIYMAICLMKIAKKTDTLNGWFAWIPILNLVLMIQVAKKPMWWIIMFFIPIANIVFMIMLWMAVAEAVKKPNWWGILMIIPVFNLIVPGYLAFSKMEEKSVSAESPVQPAA